MSTSIPQVRYVTVDSEYAGQRIDNFLLRELPGVPRSHVYRLLRSGQVRVDKGRVRPDRKLRAGETVRLPPVRMEAREHKRPPDDLLNRLRASILHEDADYLIIDKPAGLPAHSGTGADFGVIEVARAWERFDFIELAHRLDRDTSGVLLLALSRAALLRAQACFAGGRARKRYLAFCCGHWRGGGRTVDDALSMQREEGQRRARANREDGKSARSHFEPMTNTRFGALCEVTIDTGRTHQIRAHAEHIGHPVAGDRKYGEHDLQQRVREAGGLKRLFLHAHRLELPAADGFGPLRAEVPLPEDLRAVMTRLERAR